MQVVKKYPDNLFSWVDLATTDPEGAKAFYGGLFGWEAEDKPTDMGIQGWECGKSWLFVSYPFDI